MREPNHTELRELCRRANLSVDPASPKERVHLILAGEEEEEENPYDRRRLQLMTFILRHWRVIRSQLTCPVRSGDPRSCFQCTDARVAACIASQNPNQQKEILDGPTSVDEPFSS